MEKAIVIIGMSIAGVLFADASVPEGGGWSNAKDWSALVIVAVVLVFIITKMLPDLHQKFVDQSKIFTDSIRESNAHFGNILDKMHDRGELTREEVAKLREHCAAANARNQKT